MKLEEALKTNRFTDERHKATLNVIYTAYWLKISFSTQLKDIGVTMEQFNVLRILKGKHPEAMCIRDIASRIIEKNSNVPRIIDRLITKKLVKRSVSKVDKRESLISLTEKGISQLALASEAIDGLDRDLISLNNAEAKHLNDLLEKLREKETI